jgi:hypothetical protein
VRIPLVSPGYLGRSPVLDSQRMVNLFAEKAEGGKDVVALIGTPGLTLWTTLGSQPVRGMHTFNGLAYVVSGGKLYSINPATLASPALGTLATSNGRVCMADNGLKPTGGDQLAIADGTWLYIWDVGAATFTQTAIPAATVTFCDGYFLADIGGSQFQVSALYNGTTWNSADKSTADAFPDSLLRVLNNQQLVWMFGEATTEVWYDRAGGTHPPFGRIQGAVSMYGLAARHSAAIGDNSLFWLATQKNNDQGELVGVVRADGYTPRIVTPPAILYQWSQYSTVADAWSYFYSAEGHTFYVITFPTADATWVHDASTGLWHERSSYPASGPFKFGRHLGNAYAYLNGMHLLGSYRDGSIFKMQSTAYQDNGAAIVRARSFQHMADPDGKTIFYHRFQIDAEVGGITDPAANPQASLKWSDDGGQTWGNPVLTSMGKQGQYRARQVWNALGSGRDRVFWWQTSAPLKVVLTGASAEFSVGRH